MAEKRDLGVIDQMEEVLKKWCVYCRSELRPFLKTECEKCTAFIVLEGYEKLKKTIEESPGCLCSFCLNRGGKGCTREDMKEMHHKGRKYLLSNATIEHSEELRKLIKDTLYHWCNDTGSLPDLIVRADELLKIIEKEDGE